MITIFNRKELCLTHDMKEQARVRQLLAAANIHYTVTTRSHAGVRYRRSGTIGMNPDFMYEYKIYVHKKDFDKAVYTIK